MDGVIEDVKWLFSCAIRTLKGDIMRDLQGFGCVGMEQLSAIAAHLDAAVNPFVGLETHYLQDKYIKENLDYLVSLYLFVLNYINFYATVWLYM